MGSPENNQPENGITTGEDGKFLSFRQPFDGSQPEVPPEEQVHTAGLFSHYVTSVLDNNAAVFSPQYNGATGVFDEGRRYTFLTRIDSKDVEVYFKAVVREYPDATIEIAEQQGGSVAGEVVSYSTSQDHSVRRHDMTLPSAIEQELQSKQIDRNAPMSHLEAAKILLQDSLTHAREAAANDLAETAFGLNEQPVGLSEFERLRQTLGEALAQHASGQP